MSKSCIKYLKNSKPPVNKILVDNVSEDIPNEDNTTS